MASYVGTGCHHLNSAGVHCRLDLLQVHELEGQLSIAAAAQQNMLADKRQVAIAHRHV